MKALNFLLFVVCLCAASQLYPQSYIFEYEFGDFKSSTAFYINSPGYIYLADDEDNSLIKLDTLGNKIKEVGGYGWGESTFDTPTDIYATSLNVLICDKQNHRVKAFDKDLNFISELYSRDNAIPDERFGYPISCALSSMGDLYVLDSENIRVLKFDLFGKFVLNFGGFDAGIHSLKNPKKLAISSDNSILVLEDSSIIMFDQFGNGKDIIQLGKKFSSFNVEGSNMVLVTNNEVYHGWLIDGEIFLQKLNLIGIDKISNIIDCKMFNNKLYILTTKSILVFRKGSENSY
ncbi:MAG: hypothetical protein HXY50_14435 [Ignavibacteriaceae bacterium]|nr:hypothetical protein [Ignavibacteriaceae bacterium]